MDQHLRIKEVDKVLYDILEQHTMEFQLVPACLTEELEAVRYLH
jgi:hypothetical protein